jgi:cobalamin biosynthesis Mg chelatase CobN
MLAVLAMACFPVLAQAENSGIQYEPEVPTVPTHQSSNIPSGKNQNSSNGSNPQARESGSEPATGGTAGGKEKSGADGAHSGQGNQAQGGNGDKSGSGSKGAGQSGVTNAKQFSSLGETPTESNGGSSPLVPILIAIVALAAVSIGVYYYRQRRDGSDPPVSPSAS